MGGEDIDSNLIGLSPIAHAIISVYQSEHYQFCCLHRRQRKLLPKELLPLADKWFLEQARYANKVHNQKLKEDPNYTLGVSNAISKSLKEHFSNAEAYLNCAENARRCQPLAVIAAQTADATRKRIETFKKIGHQKGAKNSAFGKMWVTNGEHSIMINKEKTIPDGYRKGRIL